MDMIDSRGLPTKRHDPNTDLIYVCYVRARAYRVLCGRRRNENKFVRGATDGATITRKPNYY